MRHRCGRSIISSFGLALLCSAAVVQAASEHAASLEERVKGAEKVVVATAQSVNARWDENSYGDRLIVSRIALKVEEVLKGSVDPSLSLDLDGGTLDGLTLRVSDLPSVQPGERAVFFLDRATAAYRPHLRGQGILKLDDQNAVHGSSVRLDDIRRIARANGK
jgi:hypothetical protein